MPGASVALLAEGFLRLKQREAKPARMAGKRDPGLDRPLATGPQLAIALAKRRRALRKTPRDPHQRIAALAQPGARDPASLLQAARLVAGRCKPRRRVELLGRGKALDRKRMRGERRRPHRGDS